MKTTQPGSERRQGDPWETKHLPQEDELICEARAVLTSTQSARAGLQGRRKVCGETPGITGMSHTHQQVACSRHCKPGVTQTVADANMTPAIAVGARQPSCRAGSGQSCSHTNKRTSRVWARKPFSCCLSKLEHCLKSPPPTLPDAKWDVSAWSTLCAGLPCLHPGCG